MIDAATLEDAVAVVTLWQRCGLTRPWNDPHADYARALSGATSTILIARDGAAVIGSVMVGYDGHRGWIYYLAVAPDRQGQGVGRTLFAAAEDWLRALSVPKIQLMVRSDNAVALGFYDAIGLARQDVVVLGRFLAAGGPSA
ncbi:GNAT family acetyltransferase [Sphingomonas sp. Leaf10]|uniref:GNAT family acetyltransferase n=1 Tax=Sphingomonas sp. Leaf10 TaxID=1735676 RepID=UPI000A3F1D4E|nr:GNAT family acetyltransferase [Sphingomonas sp. Leaf10]